MTHILTVGPIADRFNGYMKSRLSLVAAMAGTSTTLKITSVTEGTEVNLSYKDPSKGKVRKHIYNLNANKAAVIQDPAWRKEWARAVKLELAGNDAEAEKLFNDLSRRAQITFSVIDREGPAQFSKGEIVKATFGIADVDIIDESTGEVTTRHSLIVQSLSPVEAYRGKIAKGFDFDAILLEEEEPEEELQKAVKPVAAKKAAVK